MKNVVVLGAGYGSISFLKKLHPKVFDFAKVTLISKYDYHYISILLHEVVGGINNEATFLIKDIIPNEVCFVNDEVVEIAQDKIICKNEHYAYDYLVVGLGFQSDDFGIQGVKEFSFPIEDFKNASLLNQKIVSQIDRYKQTKDESDLRFIVCGGGFSGIETIGALLVGLKQICLQKSVDFNLVEIVCIEAMPDILPMFPNELVNKAKIFLKDCGVKLATGCKILRCENRRVVVQENEKERIFDGGLIIWTAGVKGNLVIEKSEFFTSHRSKVEVDSYLQPIAQKNQDLMKNIYIIGDCCMLKDPDTNRFYPPTGQIAIKQGEYLGKAFSNRILGLGVEKFTYKSQGTVCSIGDKYAIGLVGKNKISGFFAMRLKRVIEKKWLFKILGLKGLFK